MAMPHKLSIVGLNSPANAKVKRARRGMEKNWNRYNEPLKKFLKGGVMSKKRWLKHKKIKSDTYE